MSGTTNYERRSRSRTYTSGNLPEMPDQGELRRSHTTKQANYENVAIEKSSTNTSKENIPKIPPKKNRHARNPSDNLLYKATSFDTNQHFDESEEGLYISHDEIDSFPTPSLTRGMSEDVARVKQKRSNIAHRDQRCTVQIPGTRRVQQHRLPPSDSYTGLPLYAGVNKQRRPGSPRLEAPRIPTRSYSPDLLEEPQHEDIFAYSDNDFSLPTSGNTSPRVIQDIPNQAASAKLVQDLQKIRNRVAKFYRRILDPQQNPTALVDLRTFLGLSEISTVDSIIEGVHASLTAEALSCKDESTKEIYIVDFCNFKDKSDLRRQLIDMFAKPGPPSVSYQDVDAKMNAVITEFSALVEELRATRNEAIKSPAHARALMQGSGHECEGLVRTLKDNKLWIRWGTPTYLPPLSHLYMHKHPPSYETRKAVTISYIAERKRSVPELVGSVSSVESLCPPIYGRVKCEGSNEIKWQVTEFNEASHKFENRECSLPSWLEDDNPARAVLNSSNRSSFSIGAHPYSLYTVYLVVIKDFTINEDAKLYRSRTGKDNWATPSKYQFYIGTSSTGVMFKLVRGSDSHCERTRNVLQDVAELRHFRCYEGCDLIEANLALSWIRQQPRAVFVLNSFLAQNMSNWSLQKKKPFHERMLSLASHLAEGKKLGGDLYDMRYGMNGTSTIQNDEW
uniref:uncharacterized protein LOC100183120 isoform X2 n=1 Tax=Ciona intestinalis TaxID=7719 RepID=UPI000180D0C1|nr:uncharacterized protein LOC100183120 isoform X2 [Ciona intestinalis]|eukprot:XP_026690593.1 uncharacterized protein LOC100183120 isoform X2 [Ciona intestinalis]